MSKRSRVVIKRVVNETFDFRRLSSIRNTTFSGFPELAWLYLSGNRFTNPIPAEYFRSNHYLDAIWIGDNPWICNCHDPTFIDFYDFLTAVPQKVGLCNIYLYNCFIFD